MFRRILIILLVLAALLSAARLALHRGDIPYSQLEERYSTVSSRFLTLPDGLIVHYRDEGETDAPALVMIHGFASSSETWTAWQADLASDYRVISLDLPGHGLTRVNSETNLEIGGLADFISACIEELGLTDYTLVGSSLGGHAAWVHALDQPAGLNGLVLIASAGLPPGPGEDKDTPWALELVSHGWIKPMLAGGDPRLLVRNGLRSAYSDRGFVSDDLITQYTEFARAPGHREALIDIASRPRDSAEADQARLSELTLPVLIMQGDQDQIVPPEHAEQFHALIPNSELIIYEGIGHLPQEEKAMESLSDLRRFLISVQPPSSDVKPGIEPELPQDISVEPAEAVD